MVSATHWLLPRAARCRMGTAMRVGVKTRVKGESERMRCGNSNPSAWDWRWVHGAFGGKGAAGVRSYGLIDQ